MDPLLSKTLLRFILLNVYAVFVAWIFMIIEKKEELPYHTMKRMLNELRMEMNLKYNMTENDFERFVQRASRAVEKGEELDWNMAFSWGFVFTTFTTIGKSVYIFDLDVFSSSRLSFHSFQFVYKRALFNFNSVKSVSR